MRKLLILSLVLILIPIGVSKAADTTATNNVNLGCVYNTANKAIGFTVQGMTRPPGGRLQLSAEGSFGEAANAAGIETGVFILQDGWLELALLQGITTTWLGEDDVAYTAGYSGLFATFRSPLDWPGYDKPITFFAKVKRQYPMDKDGAQKSTYEFTFGVSL